MGTTDAVKDHYFDGYYLIPRYSNYAITPEGKILNRTTETILTGSVNPKGYLNFRLTRDDGYCYTWGLHRLLLYVFKNPGTSIAKLVGNHISGIKKNNSLDNLEWVTYQGNAEHAGKYKLTTKCIPISVRDIDTGEVCHYPSIISYAKIIGVSKDFINWRVKAGETKVFPERKQYRVRQDDEEWYIPSADEINLLGKRTSKKILVKYLKTGEVMEYERIKDLAQALEVPASTISGWLKHKNQPVFPGLILIKYATDKSEWREIKNALLELEKTIKNRIVIVINSLTKENRIFLSAYECAEYMKIQDTALNYRLKSNRNLPWSDGFIYRYYSDYVSSCSRSHEPAMAHRNSL
jgi:hypothetical protein